MTTAAPTSVFVAKCHECGTFIRTEEARNIQRRGQGLRGSAQCPTCPGYAPRSVFAVMGRITATPCNEKCTDATGIKCDCSCGGRHHGETAA